MEKTTELFTERDIFSIILGIQKVIAPIETHQENHKGDLWQVEFTNS